MYLLDVCIFRNPRTKCGCDLCSIFFKNNYLFDEKEKGFIVICLVVLYFIIMFK